MSIERVLGETRGVMRDRKAVRRHRWRAYITAHNITTGSWLMVTFRRSHVVSVFSGTCKLRRTTVGKVVSIGMPDRLTTNWILLESITNIEKL